MFVHNIAGKERWCCNAQSQATSQTCASGNCRRIFEKSHEASTTCRPHHNRHAAPTNTCPRTRIVVGLGQDYRTFEISPRSPPRRQWLHRPFRNRHTPIRSLRIASVSRTSQRRQGRPGKAIRSQEEWRYIHATCHIPHEIRSIANRSLQANM
jgi:hypothetical protein